MQHRYEADTDRCVCGGQIVYFDALPCDDHPDCPVGEGCEVAGTPFNPVYLVGSIVDVKLLPSKPPIAARIDSTYLDMDGSRWHFITATDDEREWEVPAENILGMHAN